LDPDAPPEDPGRAKTPQAVVATAYLARSAHVLSLACALLGDDEGSERYGHVAARARSGFFHEFVTASGRVLGDAATGYALALEFDLLPADLRAPAVHRLADLVRCADFRITTGFVGTPLITDALANNGFPELAVRLLLQTECPSWLYSVTMGATTVWERWDSMLPDGTVNPGGMTSFNHYALGAVADWMHRRLAGLAPVEPGYARISVSPILTPLLDHVSATHITPYGAASAGWVREGGAVELRIDIPAGVIADLRVAGLEQMTVGHGLHVWRFEEPLEAPSSPVTVRDVVDDRLLWEAVVDAAVDTGLARDGLDVARRLEHVLDEPMTALADGILKGVPMPREVELRSRLAGLLA
jgi:alpha-L-rhamnosidase